MDEKLISALVAFTCFMMIFLVTISCMFEMKRKEDYEHERELAEYRQMYDGRG